MSTLLIAGGIGILSASPVIMILQLLKVVIAPPSPDAPWWIDPATGFLLVTVGLLFFFWFFWSDPDRIRATPPPQSLTLGIGKDWTFNQAAIAIGQRARKPVVLKGFAESELNVRLRGQQISGPTPEGVLKELGALAETAMPGYDVLTEESTILVVRRE